MSSRSDRPGLLFRVGVQFDRALGYLGPGAAAFIVWALFIVGQAVLLAWIWNGRQFG